MNANEISLDITDPSLSALKDIKPGEDCVLKTVKVQVNSNDGETLTGTPTEVEVCAECGGKGCQECDPEAEAEPAAPAKPAPKPGPSMAKQAMAAPEE